MSEIRITVPFCTDDYILIPACCYNGNRFVCLPKKYPPMFTPEEASVDMPNTITDVPRLEPDGSGKIEVTTGDASVPVSVYILLSETGDTAFLTLFREITETISQYMSTEERPVYAIDGEKLPAGFICERVNMSDWESYAWVGSVFNGSCWCEVSNLLVFGDM